MLRRKIFEIENSIAMYHIFESVFEKNGTSRFRTGWRAALADIRRAYDRPVALLACTEGKYEAMLGVEFGREGEWPALSDEKVREITGFDRYFGPREFREYIARNDGKCDYLLFVRASDPVSRLRNPGGPAESSLLLDSRLRRIIKEHSLTFNVDNPDWSMSDPRRINDTKAYMPLIRMAISVESDTDIYTPEFQQHLRKKKAFATFASGRRLSPTFTAGIKSLGVNPDMVEAGSSILRFKPMRNAYGCYGHLHGSLTDTEFRRELRVQMRKRGPYVVQPEILNPTISGNGHTYIYMDRNFMTCINGSIHFIGGFRMLMPIDSWEARLGRNHGSRYSVWAEIDCEAT